MFSWGKKQKCNLICKIILVSEMSSNYIMHKCAYKLKIRESVFRCRTAKKQRVYTHTYNKRISVMLQDREKEAYTHIQSRLCVYYWVLAAVKLSWCNLQTNFARAELERQGGQLGVTNARW